VYKLQLNDTQKQTYQPTRITHRHAHTHTHKKNVVGLNRNSELTSY